MKNTRLYLNVPFKEKDEAKALGARWNPERKEWYITYKKNYHLFRKWFYNSYTNLIIYNYLYIAIANRECFKCKKQTPVISLAADNIVDIPYYDENEDEDEELIYNEVYFICDIDVLPTKLSMYLKDRWNYYYGYSRFTNSYYYGNHCSHCNVLQGDFHLHAEPTSPFCISEYKEETIRDLNNITFLKLKLDNDLELCCSLSWSVSKYLIEGHSTIKDLYIE